jgi:tetratricopeptide (TPR) repeat protein
VFGRYRIHERLGVGADGVSYRAYDPQLEREVALKFPRFDAGALGDRQRARLLREAETLATLAHPNVVAIYDVVLDEDDVCLICEHVRGQTVRRWLEHMPRTPRQIMGVFREAGRGLAAVHDAGLVHRDFKPDNVIVGRDGRVRIIDFGLARGDRRSEEEEADTQVESGHVETMSAASPSLTQPEAVVSPPLYASPEQHQGAAVDARSDQWAFCMTFAEALLGRYPLEKSDLDALAVAKQRRIRLRDLPAGVPSGWRRPLERGLRRDPARRFESMNALLSALERPSPPLGRRLLAAAGGVGLAAAAVAIVVPNDVRLEAGSCEQTDGLDSVWNGSRRSEVRRVLLEFDEPHVSDTFDRAQLELDGFASAWWTHWNEACAAAQQGEIDRDALREEQACLGSLAAELGATLSAVEHSPSEASRNLLRALDQLSAPAECSEPARRARWRDRPTDESLAAEADAAYEVIAEAVALRRLGEHTEALHRLEALRQSAPAHRPLQLQLDYQFGKVASELGRHRQAVTPLTQAFFEAEALGDGYERIALDSAMTLAEIYGVHRAGEPDDARTWHGYAEAVSRRLAPQDPLAEANLRLLDADVLLSAGRFEEAVDPLRDAVATYERPGEQTVGYGAFAPRQKLAVALLRSGQGDEAVRELQVLDERMQVSLGPSHPALAPVLLDLGAACDAVGDPLCAEHAYERLEPLVRHYHPETSALTAAFAFGMGGVHARAERFRLARRYRQDALAAAESVYGPQHVQTAIMMYGLASVELELGELTSARVRLERAGEIFRRELGRDNAYGSRVELALARVDYDRGDIDEAQRHARAVESFVGDPNLETRAGAAEILGRVALRRGAPQLARQHLADALRLSIDAVGVDAFDTRQVEAELGAALAEGEYRDAAVTVLSEIRTRAIGSKYTPRQRARLQLRAADIARRLGRDDDARALIDDATRQSLHAPASSEQVRKEISRWRERHGL